MNEDLREKAFRRILNTRYADAPFIALEHVLRIAEALPESDVIGCWLLRLPRYLARVSTNWERPLFDLDATRREVVRQLHALQQQQPALVANSAVHPTLLHAYAAARIAPDDAARIWSAILARWELVSLRTAERALGRNASSCKFSRSSRATPRRTGLCP
ncbi:hypothetical protein EXIGLDRAFT_724525 [Exidia glandulosa HHB12029]|uniref:Uncharacterized protein n=1 Tax=Exidia glandulosa HHB12029 TaxID=1314781 RepID=A0A165ZY20_EXIGL|nr:hypothetical protein EXIGLDRAFT_724525 [Exidia glandulosa HHB12029]